MNIYVNPKNDKQFQAVLEALKPLRVEVITAEEEDPTINLLFYLSRINTKLDNLGQLKHLHEIEKTIEKERPSDVYYAMKIEELEAQKEFKQDLYNRLKKDTNKRFSETEEKWVPYLSEEQIAFLFTV